MSGRILLRRKGDKRPFHRVHLDSFTLEYVSNISTNSLRDDVRNIFQYGMSLNGTVLYRADGYALLYLKNIWLDAAPFTLRLFSGDVLFKIRHPHLLHIDAKCFTFVGRHER